MVRVPWGAVSRQPARLPPGGHGESFLLALGCPVGPSVTGKRTALKRWPPYTGRVSGHPVPSRARAQVAPVCRKHPAPRLSPVPPTCPAGHDSDSDSELSLDEQSSSYASSRSSDSEDDGVAAEDRWDPAQGPVHSTPKGK